MSNPYATPEPSDQNGQQPAWSSQQPVPPTQPQSPYGQGAYGQAEYGQGAGQQPQGQASYSQYGAYPQQGQQTAWGQPGYGQYGTAPLVDVERLRSNSTIVLVLGILGLVQILPIIGSIIAWVWGNSLVRQAREAGLPDDVTQNARIGKILGIISVALWALFAVLIIVLIVIGVAASSSSGSY